VYTFLHPPRERRKKTKDLKPKKGQPRLRPTTSAKDRFTPYPPPSFPFAHENEKKEKREATKLLNHFPKWLKRKGCLFLCIFFSAFA